MPDAPNARAPADGPPPSDDPAQGGGVFSEPERARLVAAFRAGNATATAAELAAFVAWAAGVRVDGGLLTLVLQGLAVPIRRDGDRGYQFRAATEAELAREDDR